MNDFAYKPINPLAEFTDKYGETQIIHRPKGNELRVFKGDTPTLRMNRVCARLMGAKIKARRLELGLSQRELCSRAGFRDNNPKQRIWGIENSKRGNGVRLGTLFALSYALRCEVHDLLPTLEEVCDGAGIKEKVQLELGE